MNFTKEQMDEFEQINFDLPKFGDVIYKQNDWIEEDPYKVIQVVEDKDNVMLKTKQKQKSGIFNIYALSRESGFRKFVFSWGGVIRSIKVRDKSKKELELKEIVINK